MGYSRSQPYRSSLEERKEAAHRIAKAIYQVTSAPPLRGGWVADQLEATINGAVNVLAAYLATTAQIDVKEATPILVGTFREALESRLAMLADGKEEG